MTLLRFFQVCTLLICLSFKAAAAMPAGATVEEDDHLKVISIPHTSTMGDGTFYIAKTKAYVPHALLVFSVNGDRDMLTLLTNPGWQYFATAHRLALAAVDFAPDPPRPNKGTPPLSSPTHASVVLQVINHEFGEAMPLVLYGESQQAALTEGLLGADPKRVLGWFLRAPDHLKGLGSVTPPGILVCYKENKPAYDALLADFAQARKLNARITWVALKDNHLAESQTTALDGFVQSYFDTLFNLKMRSDAWENIDTKQPVGARDLSFHPEGASYLPHPILASQWGALHVTGGATLASQPLMEREVDTFNPAQPKLHLYLRRPKSDNGTVVGVLAYSTWYNDRNKLLGVIQNPNDYLVRYAEEHHLALLTWNVAEAFNNTKSGDQRSYQENFVDNLGFEKLANAWERGVHALCQESGVPENDFLLYGISRGAQWAHRLALRKPEHFLAVHIHVNSSYDLPTPAAKNILWLQTTGEREYGYMSALRFYARCRELGYPILFKAGINLGHSSSPQIEDIGVKFFDYALGIKARRDEWISRRAKSTLGKVAPPDLMALSGLGRTPYYADLINQEVYPADERDMVPAGQRVPIPTKALAQAWGEMADTPALTLVSNASVSPATTTPVSNAAMGNAPSYFGSKSPEPSNPVTTAAPTKVVPEEAPNYFGSRTPVSSQQEPAPAPTDAPVRLASTNPPEEAAKLPHVSSATQTMPPVNSVVDNPTPATTQALPQPPAATEKLPSRQGGRLSDAVSVNKSPKHQAGKTQPATDPVWATQVARMIREQSKVHQYSRNLVQASFQRAAVKYPGVAKADSAANSAFLAEYRRLKERLDLRLEEPTWPEQVARTVTEKGGAQW